jgi:hypothetical protein
MRGVVIVSRLHRYTAQRPLADCFLRRVDEDTLRGLGWRSLRVDPRDGTRYAVVYTSIFGSRCSWALSRGWHNSLMARGGRIKRPGLYPMSGERVAVYITEKLSDCRAWILPRDQFRLMLADERISARTNGNYNRIHRGHHCAIQRVVL